MDAAAAPRWPCPVPVGRPDLLLLELDYRLVADAVGDADAQLAPHVRRVDAFALEE